LDTDKNIILISIMLSFSKKIAASFLASSIIVGGVTPALAQYSCPSREIQSVHEVGNFKFELKGCQRSGKKVTCSAWMTQTNTDLTAIYYTSGTRLVDTAGTEYPSVSIQYSSQKSTGNIGISLVKDIPIQFSATFIDVPSSVEDIALFEVNGNIKIQFRNIKITESKGGNPSAIKKKK
jgi:hypothetical protein